MSKILPMKNNLFVEIEKDVQEAKTAGGIVLPGEEKTKIVTVAIAGENEFGVEAGDKILLNPNCSFLEFIIGAIWYQMIPASSIIAKIED